VSPFLKFNPKGFHQPLEGFGVLRIVQQSLPVDSTNDPKYNVLSWR
jgi:hypothetical protein